MLSTSLVSPLVSNTLVAMREAGTKNAQARFPDPGNSPFSSQAVVDSLVIASQTLRADRDFSPHGFHGFHARITAGVPDEDFPLEARPAVLGDLARSEFRTYFFLLSDALIVGVRVLIAYNHGRLETARLMPSQERALVLAGIATSLHEIGLTNRALTVFTEAVQQGSRITRPDLRTRTLGMLRMTATSNGIAIEVPT